MTPFKETNLAYVVGVALGDGNLSNPNGRATRLRITCDLKYPKLIERVIQALQEAFPENKVNTIRRPRNCTDVYCYSNKLEKWLGWQAGKGSKFLQEAHVPDWIIEKSELVRACLKGLFETDGSIYHDRGYQMVNFVTIIPRLAEDVSKMVTSLGFQSHSYKIQQRPPQKTRYNIRISKNVEKFIQAIQLDKS